MTFLRKDFCLFATNPAVMLMLIQDQCWAAQSLHLKGRKGRIHIGGGFGAMGCGLP